MSVEAIPKSEIRPLLRSEYERLVALDSFSEERVELLDGIIVRVTPHGPLHDGTLDMLAEELRRALGRENVGLRIQSAFVAGDRSEPEPDIAVVPRRDYRVGHPHEAHLIVEIVDSSLDRDLRIKSRLYAGSGVPDYWVVDLAGHSVRVFRNPTIGGYTSSQSFGRAETISLASFPTVEVRVDSFLG